MIETRCFSSVPDGDLYTGTVADFSGMDPIIYREPLQTEQYDSMSLNGKFVSKFGGLEEVHQSKWFFVRGHSLITKDDFGNF